jgi:hypothetical protein
VKKMLVPILILLVGVAVVLAGCRATRAGYETILSPSRLHPKHARQRHHYSMNQCFQALGEYVAKAHGYALWMLQVVARPGQGRVTRI